MMVLSWDMAGNTEGDFMSIEVNIFINDIKNISKETCEQYLSLFNMKVQIHPDIEFETHTGFLPFKVEFTSKDVLQDQVFLSGFEFYSETYEYAKALSDIKKRGIRRLFSKTKYIINADADKLLNECSHLILLQFGSGDSFEPILALAFSSYLADTCNGVVYDCQSGDYYFSNVRQEISEQIEVLFDLITPDTRLSHSFDEWI